VNVNKSANILRVISVCLPVSKYIQVCTRQKRLPSWTNSVTMQLQNKQGGYQADEVARVPDWRGVVLPGTG
jgi:hypothetical protein